MDDVLPLLPARGLDQSILLPVLVGMLIMLFFTETYGWGFVGVVVPGYLASVLAIEPLTGVAIFVEAMVTLALARGAATVLSRAGGWTEFFGRDRFFLIVFISVVVRQHDHTWFFPGLAAAFDYRFGTQVLLEQRFFSVGLVIVPLMANMFWKPGRLQGLIQISTIVLATWATLELVLLPHTNLSFGSFELTYENAALDFLGNAKAYMILLTTAYLGAAFNLRYGWDFNGILIPALLALLCLTPLKLLATLAESVLLLYAARLALRLPGLRTANLEGPRKIAFVFSLAFVLKWLTGFALGDRLPGLRLTDVFAFGYLLSSLLAVRMLQKKTVRGVLLPAIFTAILGFVAGSVLGFALEMVAPRTPFDLSDENADVQSTRLLKDPEGVVALGGLRAADVDRGFSELSPRARAAYGRAWEAVAAWVRRPTPETRAEAFAASARIGLQLHAFPLERETRHHRDQRAVHVLIESERQGARFGFELALLRPGAPGPALLLPHPALEPSASEAAWQLCLEVDCPLVVLAGGDSRDTAEDDTSTSSLYELATAQIRELARVEVRGDPGLEVGGARLHVHGSTPPGIGGLTHMLPGLTLDWSPPPRHEGFSDTGLSVLRVNPKEFEARAEADALEQSRLQTLDEALETVLARMRDEGRSVSASEVDPPSRDDLRYLERLLAAPLLDAAERTLELQLIRAVELSRAEPGAPLPPDDNDLLEATLQRIAARANLLGFDLIDLPKCVDEERCWVLADRRRPSSRGWGILVIRPAGRPELAIEVPRPQRSAGTRRLGLDLWAASQARVLLLGGADSPTSAFDPDPCVRGNNRTPFQALHQGLEAAKVSPRLVLQVRGIAAWRPLEAEVVVGAGRPISARDELPPELAPLFEGDGALAWISQWVVADGSPDLYSLSGAGVPQLEYSAAIDGAEVVSLWFAEPLRRKFRELSPRVFEESLARLKLDFQPLDEGVLALPQGWRSVTMAASNAPSGAQLSAAALEADRKSFEAGLALAEAYARSRNIHRLRNLRDWADAAAAPARKRGSRRTGRAATPDIEFMAGNGIGSGQPLLFLSVTSPQRRFAAFIKLSKDFSPSDERRVWMRADATVADLRAGLFERARTVQLALERVPEAPTPGRPAKGEAELKEEELP
jgi:hypothetical protein